LYVTALKYAGVPITESIQPGYITSVKAHQCKDALTAWQASIQPPQVQEEKPTVLKVENLNFSYDGIRNVLEEINFELKEGEMVSLIGKNGSGKSTLSKLICGFEKQDQGIISYRGNDTRDKSIKERAEIIGLVLQNPNQMISKNLIFDEVALGLRFRKIPEEEIVPRVEKVLDVCGLAPFIEWPISALSYGQRKRVTIASILVMGSEILILDEPTAGQDYRHYTEIMEFLVEINKMGVTIILITHDMHLMLEYTPRALVLAEGHLIADAPASSVLTDLQIIQKANLKETSLYHLAQMAEIPDSTAFVQGFINYERKLKNR